MLVDHFDHEVGGRGGILGLAFGISLFESLLDDAVRIARSRIIAFGLEGLVLRRKGTLPGEFPMNGLPRLEAVRRVDQGPGRTGVDGDAAQVACFQCCDGVQCDLWLPGIRSV